MSTYLFALLHKATFFYPLLPCYDAVTVKRTPTGKVNITVTGPGTKARVHCDASQHTDALRTFFSDTYEFFTYFGGDKLGYTLDAHTRNSGHPDSTILVSEFGALTTLGALKAACQTILL